MAKHLTSDCNCAEDWTCMEHRKPVFDMIVAAQAEGFQTGAGIAGFIFKRYGVRVDIVDIEKEISS